MATRDFLRSVLNPFSEELHDSAQRRHKVERTEQRRLARRQAECADALAFDEPADDSPPTHTSRDLPGSTVRSPRKSARQAAGTELAWGA